MVSVRYENTKFVRSIALPLAALLSLAGGLIVWIDYTFLLKVAPIEIAALTNAGKQLGDEPEIPLSRGDFKDETLKSFDDWLIVMYSAGIISTFILAAVWGFSTFVFVPRVQAARRKCRDVALGESSMGNNNQFMANIRDSVGPNGETALLNKEMFMRADTPRGVQEANNSAGFVSWGYYISAAFVTASLILMGTVGTWAIVNYTNTEEGASDYYFFLLVIVGATTAAAGHLVAIVVCFWLGKITEEICTKDKLLELIKIGPVRREQWVNSFAGMGGQQRGGTRQRLRRRNTTRRSSRAYAYDGL